MNSPIYHSGNQDGDSDTSRPRMRLKARPLRVRYATPTAEGRSQDASLRQASRAFSGDRAMLALQRQLAIEPAKVPQPPLEDTRKLLPSVKLLCAIIGVAGLTAWGFVSLPAVRKGGNGDAPPDISQMPSAINHVKAVEVRSPTAVPGLGAYALAAAIQPPAVAASSVPTLELAPLSSAPNPTIKSALAPFASGPTSGSGPNSDASTPPISEQALASPPSGGTAVRLADEEVAMLIKRGNDLLTSGDVPSARLLFRRATSAGSSQAALLLGTTFDPLIIHRMGAVGIATDIARARKWYQKAADLGSAAALQRLKNLEQSR